MVDLCTAAPKRAPSDGVRDAAVPYKVLLKFRRKEFGASGQVKPCFGCNVSGCGEGVVHVRYLVEVNTWVGGHRGLGNGLSARVLVPSRR